MCQSVFCVAVSVAVHIAAVVPRELQEMTSVPVQYRHDQIALAPMLSDRWPGFKMFN